MIERVVFDCFLDGVPFLVHLSPLQPQLGLGTGQTRQADGHVEAGKGSTKKRFELVRTKWSHLCSLLKIEKRVRVFEEAPLRSKKNALLLLP